MKIRWKGGLSVIDKKVYVVEAGFRTVLFLLLQHLISSSLPVNVRLQSHWSLWGPQRATYALSQNLAFAHFCWKCSSPLICEPAPLTPFRFKYEPLIEDIIDCTSVNFTPSLQPFDSSYLASLFCFSGFFSPYHLSIPNTIYMLLISLVDLSLSVTGLTFVRTWQGVSLCCSQCLDSCMDHHINTLPYEVLNK